MKTPSLESAGSTPARRSGTYFGLGTYLGLAGALLAMIVLFSFLSSHFLSYATFSTLANQIPDLMVLAVGMTFVLIIGLAISLFQAVTTIHEQTLAFVPKALAVIGVLLLLLPWIVRSLIEFTTSVIQKMPQMIH